MLKVIFGGCVSVIDQNIEQDEHSSTTSADLRIRKTQVTIATTSLVQVDGIFGFMY